MLTNCVLWHRAVSCHAISWDVMPDTGWLQRAQSADMGQLGTGLEAMEVITEVDAWDKACSILESGCTPQQACAPHLSPCPALSRAATSPRVCQRQIVTAHMPD